MSMRARFTLGAAFLAACAATSVLATARQQTRDSTAAAQRQAARAGTLSVAGRVLIAGDPMRPARKARVTLTDIARMQPGRTATTDDTGAFAFDGLRAGRFELQATKPGYLRASYGASRPERAGTPVVVQDGETVTGLTMTMERGGVITGMVRDARGRPAVGLDVRVLRIGYRALTGERTLSTPGNGASVRTDDRGIFRAYGLPPGGYFVLADVGILAGRTPGLDTNDIRVLSPADVQRAMQAAREGTPPAPAASMPSSPPSRVNYAPVFYPGVSDIAAAATVTLGVGEERAGVDISIQLVPTATVRGTVTSPSGPLPAMLSVSLVPGGQNVEMLAGAGIRGFSMAPRADGTYAFTGVPPGEYTVLASLGRGRGSPSNVPIVWARADVSVSGGDIDVPLQLRPGIVVRGRVVFEGAQPDPEDLQKLSFMLTPFGSGGQFIASGGGHVDADGQFTFAGLLPNVYSFAINWTSPAASDRWTLKASVVNGTEAYESPLRFDPDVPNEWTVTFTDRPTTLSGVFQDRGGRAASDYYLLLFPTDRARWTPGSRRIRMTRPATDGAFALKGVPAGDYYLAALIDLESGEWNDPTLLDALVQGAARVTLRDGEATRQDFRIGG